MTNYPAITMFFLFVFGTLIITYWAAKRTKSRAHFYAAGGTARAISGPADWGYIPAAGLITATTQGRIAGHNGAKHNKRK